MKILITGGAGYIGSITAAKLIEADHEITILDSLEMGHQKTLDTLKKDFGDFEFLKVDLRKKEDIIKALKEKKFDACIHFAAFIEVGRSIKEPELFMENNYDGSKNLFEVLASGICDKVVFSSTAAVYGHPDSVPIPETAKISPLNPYGESKVKTEAQLIQMAKDEKLSSVRLRYFNPAGSYKSLGELHRNESHLIPLILQTAKGVRDKLYIYGDDYDTKDGTPIRDYIHIEDLADAHIKALEYLIDFVGTEVFNIGTGEGNTVKEVFEIAKDLTKKEIKYEIVERRDGDSRALVADASKIKKVIGWQANYDIRDIIESAWRFCLQ